MADPKAVTHNAALVAVQTRAADGLSQTELGELRTMARSGKMQGVDLIGALRTVRNDPNVDAATKALLEQGLMQLYMGDIQYVAEHFTETMTPDVLRPLFAWMDEMRRRSIESIR